jgi:hypothetical protein
MPRQERKTHNQALFRAVNDRVAELSASLGVQADTERPSFICECPRIGCRDFVRAPLEVYTRVRDDPTLFLVLKGHEDGREATVADLGAYLIVRSNDPAPNKHTATIGETAGQWAGTPQAS